MAKTYEQLDKEFKELAKANGFTEQGINAIGKKVYARDWEQTVTVAFYGEKQSHLRMELTCSYGIPILMLYKNGRKIDCRDYSCPKRAFNALKEIAQHQGFEW